MKNPHPPLKIDLWLREQRRKAQAEAIAAYARKMAGSTYDLDPALESAALEHLSK